MCHCNWSFELNWDLKWYFLQKSSNQSTLKAQGKYKETLTWRRASHIDGPSIWYSSRDAAAS